MVPDRDTVLPWNHNKSHLTLSILSRKIKENKYHNELISIHLPLELDVYEESEADLVTERNNNDWYRSTQSRSPDAYYSKGSKNDRKLSSGYFISQTFITFFFCRSYSHYDYYHLNLMY